MYVKGRKEGRKEGGRRRRHCVKTLWSRGRGRRRKKKKEKEREGGGDKEEEGEEEINMKKMSQFRALIDLNKEIRVKVQHKGEVACRLCI
jgi:hypothetical protein